MDEENSVEIVLTISGFNPQRLLLDAGEGGLLNQNDLYLISDWVQNSIKDTLEGTERWSATDG